MQEAATMYEQTDYYDPNENPDINNNNTLFPSHTISYHQSIELDINELQHQQQQQGFINNHHHLFNQSSILQDQNHHLLLPTYDEDNHNINNYDNTTHNPEASNNTPDLLNLFRLPNSSNIHHNTTTTTTTYDSLFHLNYPPQPPLLTDLFQSYNNNNDNGVSFFNGDDVVDNNNNNNSNGVLEFNKIGKNGKITKHFASERQRRVHWNEKYKALRSLIPHPTKGDRASIVGDAIDYIKELLRTVNELKILVDKKKCARERRKRHKTEDVNGGGGGGDADQSSSPYNSSLRSSWLQRKSKDTEVDVRIIDDEVTIKLVQRKVNCLLFVSKLLDELQMDIQHVAGGHIGDYYSFLFNSKIDEGSSVYASSIANKLIEVIETQPAALPPTFSY
ncbi:hypothetical protein ACFE04_019219 [Oxalis oulophora]